MKTRSSSRPTCRGLTLVEAAAAVATAAIALTSTLPGFKELRQRRQLEGAAAQLSSDLLHARTLSVTNGLSIRFTTHQSTEGTCYVVHTGTPGSCSCNSAGVAHCAPGSETLRVVGFGSGQPLRFTSNTQVMTFDSTRGTVTPTATMTLSTPSGAAISKVISLVGRVRTCSPNSSMAGHLSC